MINDTFEHDQIEDGQDSSEYVLTDSTDASENEDCLQDVTINDPNVANLLPAGNDLPA